VRPSSTDSLVVCSGLCTSYKEDGGRSTEFVSRKKWFVSKRRVGWCLLYCAILIIEKRKKQHKEVRCFFYDCLDFLPHKISTMDFKG
jgi:hypothetical protein